MSKRKNYFWGCRACGKPVKLSIKKCGCGNTFRKNAGLKKPRGGNSYADRG